MRYIVKVKCGNFNTGTHYTKDIRFDSDRKESGFLADLERSVKEAIPYSHCWWILSVDMLDRTEFLDSFN